MNGALIGFGVIAGGHYEAYKNVNGLSIVAIVDPTFERLELAKSKDKSIRVYRSIEELFTNEKVDFIDICTPPDSHKKYIKLGLENGCHVMCEKPFLTSREEYKGLLSLIRKSNKSLYPSHNYKFAPILKQIYKHVQSDDFGKIVKGHFRTLRSGHAVGVSEWNPNWRRQQEISKGGILRDHGTHSVYMATHITSDIPVSVSCISGNLKNDKYKANEDTALLTLYFSDHTQFLIDITWAASYRNSYYSVTGTKQSVTVENDEILYTKDGLVHKEILTSDFNDPTHKTWFVDLLTDFVNFTKSPERQIPLLTEALMTTLVLETAYESSKKGGTVLKVPSPDISYFE